MSDNVSRRRGRRFGGEFDQYQVQDYLTLTARGENKDRIVSSSTTGERLVSDRTRNLNIYFGEIVPKHFAKTVKIFSRSYC